MTIKKVTAYKIADGTLFETKTAADRYLASEQLNSIMSRYYDAVENGTSEEMYGDKHRLADLIYCISDSYGFEDLVQMIKLMVRDDEFRPILKKCL